MFDFPVLGTAAIVLSAVYAAAAPPLSQFPKAGVSCLAIRSTATAQWFTAAGQSCTWSGVVGSNFGVSPLNGREYVEGNAFFLFLFFHSGLIANKLFLKLSATAVSDGVWSPYVLLFI